MTVTETESEKPRVVAQRYMLLEPLGQGEHSEVWRAVDRRLDREVALKLMKGERAMRTRLREASLMRRLDLPGIVEILGEGIDADGTPFIVTTLIEGTPFPAMSSPASWPQLYPLALRLLHTLALLHAKRIVHADLKPANVLVDDRGGLTLIDLGFSQHALDAAPRETLKQLGTPRYMAPELFRAQPPSPRSDLFAVGLMLLEALSGRPACDPSASLVAIMRERLMAHSQLKAVGSLEVSNTVREVLSKLLAPAPEARPESAVEALSLLGAASTNLHIEIPKLGQTAHLEHMAQALEDRRSLTLVGAPKSGKTHSLELFEASLKDIPRLRLNAGGQPFESLEHLALELEDTQSFAEVEARLQDEVLGVFEAGGLLLADDLETLDPWSLRLLHTVCDRGCVIATSEPTETTLGQVIELEPLRGADLELLFEGPEVGFHFKSDGARALIERTAGLPGRVVEVIGEWLDASWVTWNANERLVFEAQALKRIQRGLGGHVVSMRTRLDLDDAALELLAWMELLARKASLDELMSILSEPRWRAEARISELERLGFVARDIASEETWVMRLVTDALARVSATWLSKAQARVFDLLTEGHPARFELALRGEDPDLIVREALAYAAQEDAQSKTRVVSGLREAIWALRGLSHHGHAAGLIDHWAVLAVASESPAWLEEVAWEFHAHDHGGPLVELVDAALLVNRGELGDVFERLARMAPFEATPLEFRRYMCMLQAVAPTHDLDAIERILDQAATRFEAHSEFEATIVGWRGNLAYERGDFPLAASLHAHAAQHRKQLSSKLASYLNQAAALTVTMEYPQALSILEEIVAWASQSRDPKKEIQATSRLRWVRYHLKHDMALYPDVDLINASKRLGNSSIVSMTLLLEAAIAWRNGEHARARTWSEEVRHWNPHGHLAMMARAFALFLANAPENARLEHARLAVTCPFPRVRAQMLRLLTAATPLEAEVMRTLTQTLDELSLAERTQRFEIISLDEELRPP